MEAPRTWESPLLRYTTRLTGDLDTARDVVQDCFLRLCRQRRAKVQDHLAEWLHTVCRNRALELSRTDLRRGKTMVALDPDQNHDPARSRVPIAALERRETHAEVRAGIAGLPERDQELLRLKFLEDLSYKQISAVTDLSVSNVGFILHRAIRRLRSELLGSGGDGRPARDNGHPEDGETGSGSGRGRTTRDGDPGHAGARVRATGSPRTTEQRKRGRSQRRQA